MDKLFDRIISCENLFLAWKEFRRGKRGKTDVQTFEYRLEDNLFDIRSRLLDKSYRHGPYSSFYINDPKSRNIQKARVADRIVHHAIYRALYPTIDGTFIFDSYSCRLGKGTHKAVDRLEGFIRKASKNYRNRCLVLKCDVRKFFDSVDHGILLDAVAKTIKDTDTIWLIREIVQSFASDSQLAVSRERERERDDSCLRQKPLFSRKGIPIGNLTSQLFANIYLDKLDKFIKHEMDIRYYVRYCDDFAIVEISEDRLENLIPKIQTFLSSELKLYLHEDKVSIRRLGQGIDFLGYVILPGCRVLRTRTKKRIIKRVDSDNLSSYLGILKHCKGQKLEGKIIAIANFSKNRK